MNTTRRVTHLRKIMTALVAALAVIVGTSVFLPSAAQAVPCDEGGSVCIDSVSPDAGLPRGGAVVTIRGNHFRDLAIDSVKFGGVPGTALTVRSNEELVVTTPAHASGTVDIELFEGAWLMHTRPGGFEYVNLAALTWTASEDAAVGEKFVGVDFKNALDGQYDKFRQELRLPNVAVSVAVKRVAGSSAAVSSLGISTKASKKPVVCKLAKNKKSVKMLRAGTCTISAQLIVKARKKAPKHKAAKRNVKLVVSVR